MTTSFKSEAVARLHSQAGSIERKIDHLKNDVSVEVDDKACAYQQEHPDVSYSAALDAVFAEHPNLAKKFNESFIQRKTGHVARHADIEDEDGSSVSAGKQLDDLALAWLREHPAEKHDYAKALQWAMDTHPDLAMLWKKSFQKAL